MFSDQELYKKYLLQDQNLYIQSKCVSWSVESDTENKFYVYCCCPFGHSVAGQHFSKVLQELERRWCEKGIAVVLYLDDGFITSDSVQMTESAVKLITQDLSDAGFILNDEKSVLQTSQQLTWLGFIFNYRMNEFIVPAENAARLKAKIDRVLHFRCSCSALDVAKVIGKICSLFYAYGPLVYLETNCCSMWVADRDNCAEWGLLCTTYLGWSTNLYFTIPPNML